MRPARSPCQLKPLGDSLSQRASTKAAGFSPLKSGGWMDGLPSGMCSVNRPGLKPPVPMQVDQGPKGPCFLRVSYRPIDP